MAARSCDAIMEAMSEEANMDLVTVRDGHVLMVSLLHARSGHPIRIDMLVRYRRVIRGIECYENCKDPTVLMNKRSRTRT